MSTPPNPLRVGWAVVSTLIQFAAMGLAWIVIAILALAVLGKLFA